MFEDLQGKKVIIFGAGNNGKSLLEKLVNHGITPAYFVDNKSKEKYIQFNGHNYSIFKPDVLENEEKENLKIIITAAKPYGAEIHSQLAKMGMENQVLSTRVSCCESILNRLGFYCDVLGFCCESTSDFHQSRPKFPYFGTAKETIANFLEKRDAIKKELAGKKVMDVAKPCINCSFLGSNDIFRDDKIRYISVSCSPSVCQAKCVYCCAPKNPVTTYQAAEKTNYPKMIAEIIEFLKENNLVVDDCKVTVAPAEITIIPDKALLLDSIAQYECRFLTNGFIFDSQIAQSLKNNGSTINISLDSGTRETFLTVKGCDVFEDVIKNLKKYRSYGNVEIKYILMPGVNDGPEDYQGIVNVLKTLDVSSLIISFDYDRPLRTAFYPIAMMVQTLKENGLDFTFHTYYTKTKIEEFISKYITDQSKAGYERKYNHLREIFSKSYSSDYNAFKEYARALELKELTDCLKPDVYLEPSVIEKYFFSFEPVRDFVEHEIAEGYSKMLCENEL